MLWCLTLRACLSARFFSQNVGSLQFINPTMFAVQHFFKQVLLRLKISHLVVFHVVKDLIVVVSCKGEITVFLLYLSKP